MKIRTCRLETFLFSTLVYPLYFYLSYFSYFFFFNHHQRYNVQAWAKSLNVQKQKPCHCINIILPKVPFPQMQQWRMLPEFEESQNSSRQPLFRYSWPRWHRDLLCIIIFSFVFIVSITRAMAVKPPHPAGDSQTTYIPTGLTSTAFRNIFRLSQGANPYGIGMKLRMKAYNLPTPLSGP